MNVRTDRPDIGTDRPVAVLLAVTVAIAAIGMLSLVRAALGDGVGDHRTVRVDNRAGLPLQVDVLDAGRTIADTQARSRTGVSIVAIVRGERAVPAPTPDQRLERGDTLVVVGTAEGVKALSDLLES